MNAKFVFATLLIVFCGLRAANAVGTPVETYDFFPTWAHTTGGEEVTILGCGFRTYSEVVCLWNKIWPSATSVILDDNTIICETPRGLTHADFTTLPQFVTFELLFDGVYGAGSATIYVDGKDSQPFRFGPAFFNFSPTTGVIGGGGTITLFGQGFNEFSSIDVYFDDAVVTGSASGDTQITAPIPAGKFYQNAIIDVYFENNAHFYLHGDNATYHYGPLITGFIPTCGHWAFGGDTVTVVGLNFNDPALGSGAPNVSWVGFTSTTPSIRSVMGSLTGSGVVVTAPFGQWQLSTKVQVAFANRADQIADFFPGYLFGPSVFDFTPTVGFVNGGATLTVFGCGFNNYTNSQISVSIGGSACNNVNIAGGGFSLTCTYSSGTCNTDNSVDLTFSTVSTPATPTLSAIDDFHYGPLITNTTFTPSRGPVQGGNTVTINGVRFWQAPGALTWAPACIFSTFPGGTQIGSNVVATVSSETQLTCGVPSHTFNADATVTFQFASGCTQSIAPYHYGPLCTAVVPTFGYIGGGQTVTLVGVGFTDDPLNNFGNIKFCLVDGIDGDTLCPADSDNDQTAPHGSIGATSIVVTTPVVVSPGSRGAPFKNRYFGDEADVFINFANSTTTPNTIFCGTYRYGPIVNAITPNKAPVGPTYTDITTTFTLSGVTVQGAGFADPLLNDVPKVSFETVGAASETVSSDSVITLNTLWGGDSNTFSNVTVFFDICNKTSTVEGTTLHWGPIIDTVFPIYGIKPWGDTLLTITGLGFDEFDDIDGQDHVRCIIDGFYSNSTVIEFDSTVGDVVIHCFAPENEFGTNATVIVEFGETCLNDIPDYTKTILAADTVLYAPIITAISPTFGYTSGGQPVVVFGEGFLGWDENPEGFGAYSCFFGHFKGTLGAAPTDTQVNCVTPGAAEIDRRQRFNTDVRVHVQLNGTVLTNDDWKVWYDSYHYGPLCTGFNPSHGPLPGATAVTVSGSGFQDTETFTNISIFYGTASSPIDIQDANTLGSDSALQSFNNPDGQCATNYSISLVFDALNTASPIFCGYYTYGPLYSDQLSLFGGNYGWDSESFTITGSDFQDTDLVSTSPNSTFVTVLFGSTQVSVTQANFQSNSITVNTPFLGSSEWQQEVIVSVRWSGFNKTCTITGDFYHYGPVFDSVTPSVGYVAGGTNVVMGGIAFTCCGLQSGTGNDTVCVWDGTAYNNQTTVTANSVSGCSSPANNIIGRIANAGLQFNSTSFGTSRRLVSPTNTDTPVTFYYGPNVTATSPALGPLKGGSFGPVTLSGFNLDDPWFYQSSTQVQCVFSPTNGNTPNISNSENVAFGAVVCNSPEYSRQCGAVDYVGLRYNRTDNNAFYYLPGGSSLTNYFEYAYGSVITDITTSTGELRSNTTGGLIVTLTGNWVDWTDDRADHTSARCLFGHFAQEDDVPITGSSPSNTIVCTVPEGPFDWDGEIAALLDPKWDGFTELSTVGTTYDNVWHWIPYTTDLSRVYQPEDQTYTIVALGGGFCAYDNVICYFGGSNEAIQSDITDDLKVTCQSPPLGYQATSVSLQFCDRINPDGITSEEKCACDYIGTPDTSTVPTAFTYVGFSNVISPTRGPIYGNTVVTLNGVGFSNYVLSGGNQPDVKFIGRNTYNGIFGAATTNVSASDSQLVITTPDVSGDGDQIASIQITFTRKEVSVSFAKKEVFIIPTYFDFGSPEVSSIIPAGPFDFDGGDTITLNGTYFNGGLHYYCLFAPEDQPTNITVVPGTQPDRSPQDNQGNSIACAIPTNLPHVGLYYVQAAVTNSASTPPTAQFSDNDIAISVQQLDATITRIDPTTGSEFGGTSVTVTGNSFNGASAPYLCKFGSKVVGGDFTAGTKKRDEFGSENRRSLFHTFEVDSAFGTGDKIECKSPTTDPGTVTVSVSIDGGLTWISGTGNSFTFVKGGTPGDDTTGTTGSTGTKTSAASSVRMSELAVVLASLLAALLYAML